VSATANEYGRRRLAPKRPGVRSMRNRRAAPSCDAGSKPWPSWVASPLLSISIETAKPPGPWCRAQSPISARRSPRPGENIERASRILVLPAPFSPVSATSFELNRRVQRRIGAKIAQRQPARQRSGGASVFKRHRPWLCHARAKAPARRRLCNGMRRRPWGAAPKMSIVPAARSQRGFSLG